MLDVPSVSLGSFSEAQHIFDPELLRGVFKDLSARIAFKPKAVDTRLEVFVERMVAADGSLFDALPRMVWAMYQPKNGTINLNSICCSNSFGVACRMPQSLRAMNASA
jgi:hypothetical protein